MPLDDTGSLLVITPLSGNNTPVLSAFSARGVKQSLEWIETARPRRTINGELINVVPEQFHKYKSSIRCDDINTPSLDGAFRGRTVQVDCVAELSYPSGGSANRPVVLDSAVDANGTVTYRPSLLMMVMDIRNELDEWNRVVAWEIDLEEV